MFGLNISDVPGENKVFIPGISDGWDLGAMTEFDFVANDTGGYDTEFPNTVTVGHELKQRLAMYLEFAAVAGSAPGFRWLGQVDAGYSSP